jgi:hypothetical protein
MPSISIPTPTAGSENKGNRLTWVMRSFGESGLTLDDFNVEESIVMHVIGVIMAQQYTIQKGLRLLGGGCRRAVTKELTQLHNMATYKPMHAHKLTREQHMDVLLLLMFLTQKRDGWIKGRACANGSKQRSYIDKESVTSPTVTTDSIMITADIDAMERQNLMTLDIPGAFLHAQTWMKS